MSVYSASVNPARRAKALLPKLSTEMEHGHDEDDEYVEPQATPPPPAPAKRGRKPGNMSRTAREAQRKLNHSIIEKARRTKINDALATLRQLVPDNFGIEDEIDDDLDQADDGDYGKKSKKVEKEKEFKLEILVRTVGYMQHLIERINALEQGDNPNAAKRKTVAGPQPVAGQAKKKRRASVELPSIASWLHSNIDPSLQSPRIAQLPSPPSSTSFAPVSQLYQAPPALSLGPADEDAASLLLHMSSCSPMFRARSDSAVCPPLDLAAKPLTPGLILGLRQ